MRALHPGGSLKTRVKQANRSGRRACHVLVYDMNSCDLLEVHSFSNFKYAKPFKEYIQACSVERSIFSYYAFSKNLEQPLEEFRLEV